MKRPTVQCRARELLDGNGWKLLACPFCGDPEPVLNVHAYTLDVECRSCHAFTEFDLPPRLRRECGFEWAVRDTVERWNRRVPR